jgi:hypothetical protein
MQRPCLYLILSLHRHMATTSDPMRWRGSSSAEHVCWRRSAVRWAWGHTGPFRRTPATTPSPSESGPSLYLWPLGRYSSGARGATAVQAGALEPSVNELIETTFGCYLSSKAAGVVPKEVWLDRPQTWFRVFGHAAIYTGSFCVFGPALSSPAHGTSSLAMAQI